MDLEPSVRPLQSHPAPVAAPAAFDEIESIIVKSRREKSVRAISIGGKQNPRCDSVRDHRVMPTIQLSRPALRIGKRAAHCGGDGHIWARVAVCYRPAGIRIRRQGWNMADIEAWIGAAG